MYNMVGCRVTPVSYGADGFPLSGCVSGTFSGLAQLVEHIIRNDGVRRSSRRAGAKILWRECYRATEIPGYSHGKFLGSTGI